MHQSLLRVVTAMLIFFPTIIIAQIPGLDWVRYHTGTSAYVSSNGPKIIQIDTGFVYLTGEYRNTVDFDPSTSTQQYTAQDQEDIYIQKYTSGGDMVWTQVLPGVGREAAPGFHMTSDGDIFLSGCFFGTVDFDPGPGTATGSYTPAAPNDQIGYGSSLFIMKMDSSGQFQWVIPFGDGMSHRGLRAVESDSNGDIYTAAAVHQRTNNGVNYDMDPTGGGDINSHNGTSGLIVKLDENGNYIWGRALRPTSAINIPPRADIKDMYVDGNDDVITVGSYRGNVDFDPTPAGQDIISGAAYFSIFINKLDSAGNYEWTKTIDSAPSSQDLNQATGVITDSQDNIYVRGSIRDTLDIDPGTGVQIINHVGFTSGYVLKLNSAGDYLNHFVFSDSSSTTISSMKVDANDNLYISGSFYDSLDLDQGAGQAWLVSNGQSDAFLAKYDQSGVLDWGFSIGGTSYDYGNSIITNTDGHMYLSGGFGDTVDFDPTSGVNQQITSTASSFVARFGSSSNASLTVIDPLKVEVYPNPTQQYIQVKTSKSEAVHLQLLSNDGATIFIDPNYVSEKRIDVSHLSQGTYVLVMEDKNSRYVKRFVKK